MCVCTCVCLIAWVCMWVYVTVSLLMENSPWLFVFFLFNFQTGWWHYPPYKAMVKAWQLSAGLECWFQLRVDVSTLHNLQSTADLHVWSVVWKPFQKTHSVFSVFWPIFHWFKDMQKNISEVCGQINLELRNYTNRLTEQSLWKSTLRSLHFFMTQCQEYSSIKHCTVTHKSAHI